MKENLVLLENEKKERREQLAEERQRKRELEDKQNELARKEEKQSDAKSSSGAYLPKHKQRQQDQQKPVGQRPTESTSTWR